MQTLPFENKTGASAMMVMNAMMREGVDSNKSRLMASAVSFSRRTLKNNSCKQHEPKALFPVDRPVGILQLRLKNWSW